MMRFVLAVVLCFAACEASLAQGDVRNCMEIGDGIERLKCYDAAVQSQPSEPPSSPLPSAWTIRREQSRLDDSLSVFASNTSPDGTSASVGLGIICREGRTTFVFHSDEFLGLSAAIRGAYRIDNQPPVTTTFAASTTGKGAFFRGQIISLLRSLPEGGKLFIRVYAYNGAASEGTFSLRGIDQVRREVGEACRWPAQRR